MSGSETTPSPLVVSEQDPEAENEAENDPEADPEAENEAEGRTGTTPRQARRIRVILASVLMALMAVVLVLRLANSTSVLVVGDYGLALVLCGIVIQLSRNGRTRLATWLLVAGLAAALATDWLLLP